LADPRHLVAPLLRAFGRDLVEDAKDLLPRRLILGDLPQIIGELLALGAQLAEGVEQWRVRAARCVRVAHARINYTKKRRETDRLPELQGASSLRGPWNPRRIFHNARRLTSGGRERPSCSSSCRHSAPSSRGGTRRS